MLPVLLLIITMVPLLPIISCPSTTVNNTSGAPSTALNNASVGTSPSLSNAPGTPSITQSNTSCASSTASNNTSALNNEAPSIVLANANGTPSTASDFTLPTALSSTSDFVLLGSFLSFGPSSMYFDQI